MHHDPARLDSASSIVFLHLSKTAGQTVHAFLEQLFGVSAVAPVRVNIQLFKMTIPDLRRYRVFSGHLDWALLDCIQGPKFVFTVLREPLERILSFYFFLRRDAQLLSPAELDRPSNLGIASALRLSCDDYFTGADPRLRNFIDGMFDNFYTFYFAGRHYDARSRLLARQRHEPELTDRRILDMALENLTTLDGVYRIDNLQRLENDLKLFALATGSSTHSLASLPRLTDTRVNVGDPKSGAERLEDLRRLGATEKTFNRLDEMISSDKAIWRKYCAGIEA